MSFDFINASVPALAPMAGVTDRAYRALCMSYGASYCISEMVSAKALTLSDKKTALLLDFGEDERPFGIQLFGSEPDVMASAASSVAKQYKPDFININMGCPTPKIISSGAGSALMSRPELAAEITKAVSSSVDIPVTAKIRAGFREKNCEHIAVLLEKAGAAAITVHGRTASQMYRPPVDLDAIASVKNAVTIPVIGNGDVKSLDEARQMMELTHCDGVMLGRASYGNPFVFSNDEMYSSPDTETRMNAFVRQARDACRHKGEYIAVRELRKHATWYIKGFRNAASFRNDALGLNTLDELLLFADRVIEASKKE